MNLFKKPRAMIQPSKADVEKKRTIYQERVDQDKKELRELELRMERLKTRIETGTAVLVLLEDFYGPAEEV